MRLFKEYFLLRNTKIVLALSWILVLSGFIYLCLLGLQEVVSLDFWLHLKSGEVISQRGFIFKDIFSFTQPAKTWYNHSWLFQLIIFKIYKHLGLQGLHYLKVLILFLSFFFIYSISSNNRNYLGFGLSLLFSALALARFIMLRPHLFSLFLFSLYLYILLGERKKYLSILPFAQIIWVNTHGYFILGISIVLFFFLFASKNRLNYLWTLLAVLIVSLANPYLWEGFIYPLRAILLYAQTIETHRHIKELLPLWIINGGEFKLSLLILFLLAFFSLIKYSEPILRILLASLLILGGIVAIFCVRNTPYLVLFCSFIITRYFPGLKLIRKRGRGVRSGFLLALAFLIFFQISMLRKFKEKKYFDFSSLEYKSIFFGISRERFPERGVNFVLKNKLPSRMFNDFNCGAYLVGKTFPQRRVFIDGRTEFYGREFLDDYFKLVLNPDEKIFSKIMERFELEAFFISYSIAHSSRPLLKFLSKRRDFYPVYLDDKCVIFVKDSQDLERYRRLRIDFENYKVPYLDYLKIPLDVYPAPYIKRAQILLDMDKLKPAREEAEYALKIMPHCGRALRILADIDFREEKYESAVLRYRQALMFIKGDFEVFKNLGISLFHLQRLSLSRKQFLKALKINPLDKDIRKYLKEIEQRVG